MVGGDTLVQPSQEISSGGTLSITLDVMMANVTIEWLTMTRRTFNGGFPGPTWRIKRGDNVTVNLVSYCRRHNDLSYLLQFLNSRTSLNKQQQLRKKRG